jgi:trk system potassium uptake protein TrkA
VKIIIAGCGKAGYNLASVLFENNDIIMIDENKEALERADQNLDVMCIKGNCISSKILLEAGVNNCDVLVSVTTRDETNIVCCLTAKNLGASRVIARIRNYEYANEIDEMKSDMNLDLVINPEKKVADEILKFLKFSKDIKVDFFANKNIEILEIKINKKNLMCNLKLKDIIKNDNQNILIAAILRDNFVIVPKGNDVIKENDTVYIIAHGNKTINFCQRNKIYVNKLNSVIIVGGGRIGCYLAEYLNNLGIKTKIFEVDKKRCIFLNDILPKSVIINGDGMDDKLLKSENIEDADAFISLTGRDEENLISVLLAKNLGAKKVIAKINREHYSRAINSLNLNIDNIINPGMITSKYVARYIDNIGDNINNSLINIKKLNVFDFKIDISTSFLNKYIKNLNLIENVLIAAIIRNREIIIPDGESIVKLGDHLVLISKSENITDINDIIKL